MTSDIQIDSETGELFDVIDKFHNSSIALVCALSSLLYSDIGRTTKQMGEDLISVNIHTCPIGFI
jgi:hypothetical protein